MKKNMSSHIFQFKQFSIQQDACAMKVGTDGIMLGAWARLEEAHRILDIGTGTGLLALMAAQNHPDALIDAVELDQAAAQQAQENVENSPWADRIQVLHHDIKEFTHANLYDLILCNPPFFQAGLLPDASARIQARHTTQLTHEELIALASLHMNEAGTLCLILPHATEKEMCWIAERHNLFPTKILQIRSRTTKPFHRSLMAFKKGAQHVEIDTLSIHADQDPSQYSAAFRRLTGDFYL